MENEALEKTEKVGWGIIKWTVSIVVIFSILGTLFWALFYSTYFANLSFVIPARLKYENYYWKVEGYFKTKNSTFPPFDPIYTIQVASSLNGVQYYAFWGKYDHIDMSSGLIYLKGYDGNVYPFRYGNKANLLQLFDPSLNGGESIDSVPDNTQTNFANATIQVDGTAYTAQSIIYVVFDDDRRLYQILTDYNANKDAPLNRDSIDFFEFIKFN